jgi:hypothetical protein
MWDLSVCAFCWKNEMANVSIVNETHYFERVKRISFVFSLFSCHDLLKMINNISLTMSLVAFQARPKRKEERKTEIKLYFPCLT